MENSWFLKSLSGLTVGPHKCSVVTLQLRGIHQEIFFSSLPLRGIGIESEGLEMFIRQQQSSLAKILFRPVFIFPRVNYQPGIPEVALK